MSTESSPPDAGADDGPGAVESPPTVFRHSPLIILVTFIFAFCATPFAFGAPLFWLIYLVPLGVIVWVLRTRTVVDTGSVTARTVLRRRVLAWTDVASLRLTKGSRVCAVLADDTEVRLPAVSVRHLPELSVASGGRLEPRTPPPDQGESTAEHPAG